MITSIINIIQDYYPAIISALGVTVQMCLWIWGIGIIIGSILGVLAARYMQKVGRWLKRVYFLVGGIPALVLLYWLHYPMQEILNVVIHPMVTSIVALAFLNIIAVAEIFRHEAVALQPEYIHDARVCGLSEKDIFLKIQLPLILFRSLPNILNAQVKMLHLTLFAGFISVEEIFRVAQRINAAVYKPIEIYSMLGAGILIVSLVLAKLADWIRKKYSFNQLENASS
jgi:ABC-type amino acid transport system permease subunit